MAELVSADRLSAVATVILLAAGEGTRMKSAISKVLHQIAGASLIEHVIRACAPIGEQVVVIGAGADQVREHLSVCAPKAKVVLQDRRGGTGHATRIALEAIVGDGPILVVAGDTPLITTKTLSNLDAALADHAAVILTSQQSDPTGYGRIIRSAQGGVERIVEEKDANSAEKAITEVNSGVAIFDGAALRSALSQLTTNNAQGEEYLTDVIGILVSQGKSVTALVSNDPSETLGINDRVQLAQVGALMRDRINEEHMRNGVTIIDPASTWIDPTVVIAADVTIEPGTRLSGSTTIAAGAVIGPRATLVDCTVGSCAQVIESRCLQSEIGEGAYVGPFAYLRPGTRLASGAKVGAFVEVKNSTIGKDSKVPHLSYVGDATIGEGTNIGAATVFVNYDGQEKHQTVIGDQVRIGSDTMLVAPVVVGDGAYTAAGSVITEDVPAGAMGVGRARQTNILGWVLKKRAGSKSAEAASSQSTPPGTV